MQTHAPLAPHKPLYAAYHKQRRSLNYTRMQIAASLDLSLPPVAGWFAKQPTFPTLHQANQLLTALNLGVMVLRQPNANDLGMIECLVKARKDLGLNVDQLSDFLNVSYSSIYAWEHGDQRSPRIDTLAAWSRFLGMGGITYSNQPGPGHALPVVLSAKLNPTPAEQLVMIKNNDYDAEAYIPYSLEYAKLRLAAHRMGITPIDFLTDAQWRGQPLIHAKFRPLWMKLAVRHRSADAGLTHLVELLDQRANTLDKTY